MPQAFPFYLTAERRRPDREELDKLLTRVGDPPPVLVQATPSEGWEDRVDELELTCTE
jgi:hypothetical protein